MQRALAILGLACCLNTPGLAAPHPPLRFVQAIPLDGVEGRLDHLAADEQGQRLFVAALGNGTVEIIDLRAGKPSRSLRGFEEPQGLGFVASPPRLFVANGGDGTCEILDAGTFEHLRRVQFTGDADNVRCDATSGQVYIGYGSGALARLNATTGESLGDIALPAHPESFQLQSKGGRAFANVPDAGEVAVIDRPNQRLVGEWKLEGFAGNFPMALDEPGHRLFVGCRHPAAVLVLRRPDRAKDFRCSNRRRH